jgi:hypothetical protein
MACNDAAQWRSFQFAHKILYFICKQGHTGHRAENFAIKLPLLWEIYDGGGSWGEHNIILWRRIPAGVVRRKYSIRFPWRWRKSPSFGDEANVSWRSCSIQYFVTITANPINPNAKSLIDSTRSHKVYLPIPNFPFWYGLTLKVPNNGSFLPQSRRT